MKSPHLRSPAWFLAAVLCVPAFGAVAEEKVQPPKTHVLFMGADLVVQHEQKRYRVEDIAGSEFKIHVGQEDVFIPTRNRQTGLQVTFNLKLTGEAVKLEGLQSGPAYTELNDPMKKLKEAAVNSEVVAAAQDLTQAQATQAASHVAAAENALPNSRNQAAAQRELDDAKSDLARSQGQMNSLDAMMMGEMTNVGVGAHKMAVAEGNFDAMEVSFKVSSEVELKSPYMVILFRFHAPDAKPNVDGMVVHAQALDPIDSHPRYIRVLRGGLPLGFKFVDCTVHIYNRGQEIATNVSEKRVDLTRDEARQYLVMEYIGDHKGATLAAGAISGTLPLAERQQLKPDQLTRTLYAKISKDGVLLGVYADESCNVQLDDAGTLAALGEVFFKPALKQGAPVDGVAHLRLADI